ncbi:hypothetical protein [Vibrio phage vB_VpS_PG28]|nr:hypothetical protein [Vibrio phage vB_VpS_PG28]
MVTRITPHTAPKVSTYSHFAAGHLNALDSEVVIRKPKLVRPITQETFLRIVRETENTAGAFDASVYRLYSDYVVFVNPEMFPRETHTLAYFLEEDEIANVTEQQIDDLEWCRYSEITLRVAAL